ncbi:MAG: hypothetical protein FJ296_11130, partial [Planctomycetes bacterium]|nr:hypothetical protein [Planctomycetota bacterium]
MSVLRLLPVLVLSVLAVGPAPSVRGPADAAIECAGKPEGPLMVRLASSGDPAGARRPVEVELQPVLELHDLAWRWELSPGVQLLAGDAQG